MRPRRQSDIAACIEVLAAVHAADGYPLRWPADPLGWLTQDNLLAAWVAEDAHTVVGHVALCTAAGDAAAPLWSAAAGFQPEHLAVISRLFVAPDARGHGLGAALLAEASAEARRRDLLPVLEVLDQDRGAVALYERVGWRHVASVPAPWALADDGNGAEAALRYYIAPR